MVSKRRQRELARQRHLRRQQQLAERRQRQRQRNRVIAIVLAGLLVLGLGSWGIAIAASGGKKNNASATPTPAASASTPPAAPTACAPITPNPPKAGEPKVPDVTGKAPTTLVVKDVKKGTGPAAKKGSSLSVLYIGASCSTGKVFDASYLSGNKPFTVTPLGSAQVILGWNEGLIGVRAGGVRELVIPASLGYGPSGQGAIKPNETLIFLVTVKSVK